MYLYSFKISKLSHIFIKIQTATNMYHILLKRFIPPAEAQINKQKYHK